MGLEYLLLTGSPAGGAWMSGWAAWSEPVNAFWQDMSPLP